MCILPQYKTNNIFLKAERNGISKEIEECHILEQKSKNTRHEHICP